jgi:hypothetical protein
VTLTGIKIDGRVQAPWGEGTLTDAELVLCLRFGLNKPMVIAAQWGAFAFTFFTYFSHRGGAYSALSQYKIPSRTNTGNTVRWGCNKCEFSIQPSWRKNPVSR